MPSSTSSESHMPESQLDDEDVWDAVAILKETKTKYLIKWAGTDPKTGKEWEPSWEVKRNATKALQDAWAAKKKKNAKGKGKRASTGGRSRASTSTSRGASVKGKGKAVARDDESEEDEREESEAEVETKRSSRASPRKRISQSSTARSTVNRSRGKESVKSEKVAQEDAAKSSEYEDRIFIKPAVTKVGPPRGVKRKRDLESDNTSRTSKRTATSSTAAESAPAPKRRKSPTKLPSEPPASPPLHPLPLPRGTATKAKALRVIPESQPTPSPIPLLPPSPPSSKGNDVEPSQKRRQPSPPDLDLPTHPSIDIHRSPTPEPPRFSDHPRPPTSTPTLVSRMKPRVTAPSPTKTKDARSTAGSSSSVQRRESVDSGPSRQRSEATQDPIEQFSSPERPARRLGRRVSDTIMVPSTQTQSEVNESLPPGPEKAMDMDMGVEDMEDNFLNLDYSPPQERRADASGSGAPLEPIVPFPPTASTQAADVDSQSQVDMQVDADMSVQEPPEPQSQPEPQLLPNSQLHQNPQLHPEPQFQPGPEALLGLPLPSTSDEKQRALRIRLISSALMVCLLRRNNDRKDKEISELQAALEGVRTDGLEMVRRTKDGQIERLQAEVAQWKGKYAILQKQGERTDATVRRRAAEAPQLKAELEAAQKELEEIQAENEVLKDQLATEWVVCQDAQDGMPCNSRFRDQEAAQEHILESSRRARVWMHSARTAGRSVACFSSSVALQAHRALVYSETGQPADVLRATTYPTLPSPRQDWVNVKFLLSPINPSDINTIEGVYPSRPSLLSSWTPDGTPLEQPVYPAGNEGVAVVTAVGGGVKDLKEGDRVIITAQQTGTWASARTVQSQAVTKVPEELSDVNAATITVNPATAYNMLHEFTTLKEGDWVLQNGANSAVGQAVIQIAKQKGFKTINFVRSRPNLDDLKQSLQNLGADVVLTYGDLSDKALKNQVKEITGGKSIRLMLNCVGGKTIPRMVSLLGTGAYVVSYGAMSKEPMPISTASLIFKDVQYRGFWQSRWYKQNTLEDRLALIKKLTAMRLVEPEHEIVSFSAEKSDAEITQSVKVMMAQ
ncbi:mitochondrial 2-enoyl thioester reductase [Steccherinum ochraceum]|uniref:enoyl-[acyl-carrier-protein] reductase n=1 Tax=Steccherinum ochraceum TaxID=92696 RepID=A0A4R0RN15_9APHY|nr:mitochondrial 2-enoyl thioester reductase [Steccherinum ochraceum]